MAADVATFPDSRELHAGVEAICRHDEVTPSRDEPKRIDALRLSFPLQVVIGLVIGVLTIAATVYGSVWAANSRNEAAVGAIRLDIALIRQMQADQVKIDEYKSKLDEERAAAVTRSIADLKARTEMTELKVNNLRETMLTLQRK